VTATPPSAGGDRAHPAAHWVRVGERLTYLEQTVSWRW